MRRPIVLGVLLAAGSVSIGIAAMPQAPAGQEARGVDLDKRRDNLDVMKGGGGNSSVFLAANGVVVIDTKNPGWGQPLLDAIRKVTDKPVTTIVNTHTHGDHVSGNVEFPASVEIVTHENTRANMEQMRPNSSAAPSATPPPNIFKENKGRGLPKRTFKDRLTLGAGSDRIDLLYFGPAHTNGDAVVFFPAHRIVHIADIFPSNDMPIMDSNNGGTGIGYADTLAKAAAFVDANADTLISGHNATTTRPADLKAFIQFIRTFVKEAQDAKRSGRSVDDFAASWKPPAGYGATAARVRANTQTIFNETR